MTSRPSFRWLWIGDSRAPEFAAAWTWLAAQGGFEALARWRLPLPPAEVVVLANPWRGAVRAEHVGILQSTLPLARIITVDGSWLEGSGRSGSRLAGVLQTSWSQWPAIGQRLATGGAAFSYPTATRSDRLLQVRPAPPPGRSGLVWVLAETRRDFTAAARLCEASGWSSLWWRPGNVSSRPDLLLCRDFFRFPMSTLASLRQQFPDCPLLLTRNGPRHQDLQEWERWKPVRLLPQPCSAADFTDQLAWAANARQRPDADRGLK